MKLASVILLSLLFHFHCLSQAGIIVPAKKIVCEELGLQFTISAQFRLLAKADFDKLEQRGEKAIREEFENHKQLGWRDPCGTLQDSLKRTIIFSTISVKEAVEENGSVEAFREKNFSDYNLFMAERIKTRAGIELEMDKLVSHRDIVIAGYNVKTNDFAWRTSSGKLVMLTRIYFFELAEKILMITFTGSGKASDNEDVAKALEEGRRISR